MKSKWLKKTLLAAAIVATTIPAISGTAFAAEEAPTATYPSTFTHSLSDKLAAGLTDYAVDGDTYAFAVSTFIYVVSTDQSGDRKLNGKAGYNCGTQITKIDYAEGKLYFQNTSGNTYLYQDENTPATPSEHIFPAVKYKLEIGDEQYLLNSQTTELKLFNSSNGTESAIGEGYSLLKQYGESVYAVKDNCPCLLEGTKSTPLDISYIDFTEVANIPAASVKTALQTGGYTVTPAQLKQNSYYTQIETEQIGEKFKPVKTVKADGERACLVLAVKDDLAVIANNEGCYITSAANLNYTDYRPLANDWPAGQDGTRKAYLRAGTGVYSRPYMCGATRVATLTADSETVVTVTEKFVLTSVIDTVFYRVKYTENGQEIQGFVAANFLDEYDYAAENKDKTTISDGEFVYDNNVTTVILVLVIVGLVILAIVYLTIVGTKKDGSKKKKKNSDKEE